jgi:hypothetical protein
MLYVTVIEVVCCVKPLVLAFNSTVCHPYELLQFLSSQSCMSHPAHVLMFPTFPPPPIPCIRYTAVSKCIIVTARQIHCHQMAQQFRLALSSWLLSDRVPLYESLLTSNITIVIVLLILYDAVNRNKVSIR